MLEIVIPGMLPFGTKTISFIHIHLPFYFPFLFCPAFLWYYSKIHKHLKFNFSFFCISFAVYATIFFFCRSPQNLQRSKFKHSQSLKSTNMDPRIIVKRNLWQHHHPRIVHEPVLYWHHLKMPFAVQMIWFMPTHAKWRKRPASEMVLQMLR